MLTLVAPRLARLRHHEAADQGDVRGGDVRTAPHDYLGKPIFPAGEPYCPLDGLIYPVGQTPCDRDKTLLQVRCPKCELVRDADIQTCGNCGLVL